MSLRNFYVRDYMRLLPIYVNEHDSLLSAIEYMKKFDVECISVINQNYSVVGKLTRSEISFALKSNFNSSILALRSLKVRDVIETQKFPVVFYPKMRAEDAFSFMKCFKNKFAPVVDNPWKKKILGFLWIDDAILERAGNTALVAAKGN